MTENKANKTPAIISTVLTVILLILLGALMFIMDVIALNGFSGSEGGIALTTMGVCEGVGVILSAILAGRLTNLFITKYNWNNILAIVVSVLAGTILGGVFYSIGLVLSLVVAETLH